eukprot:TRINITY_DN62730_c0_g1_i1.p1 TRINITY_DN62730_c0_g1~~TRINITY_DN62730_c0_g1_i1.p1  ORF type:complete len:382 (+),score=73.94 TRINITY_DN62730_c0_g1_i1:2-1147(+)
MECRFMEGPAVSLAVPMHAGQIIVLAAGKKSSLQIEFFPVVQCNQLIGEFWQISTHEQRAYFTDGTTVFAWKEASAVEGKSDDMMVVPYTARSIQCSKPQHDLFDLVEAAREQCELFASRFACLLQTPGGFFVDTSYIANQELLYHQMDRTSLKMVQLPKLGLALAPQESPQSDALKQLVPPELKLVETTKMLEALQRILLAYQYNQPVLLEGAAGGGKTAIIGFAAHRMNAPLIRFNMTPSTSIPDLIGKLTIVGPSSSDGKVGFAFRLGPFARAVRDGCWLLFDEANLANDAVLQVIEDVLATGLLAVSGNGILGQPGVVDGQLTIRKHPNFRLFMAQNPSQDPRYGATRCTFSVSLLSHLCQLSYLVRPIKIFTRFAF